MAKLTLRIWILIFVLILAILSIAPWKALESGVIIKSVEKNSTAFEAGLRPGMIITEINNRPIKNMEDYSKALSSLFNTTFQQNKTNLTKIIIKTKEKGEFILFTNELSIVTAKLPKSNLKTGLDLSGGARALVKPVNKSLSSKELADLIAITNERFNVYGIADITIRPVKDLNGENYMLVEIAGATPSDLKELVGKQGKFEAKISNLSLIHI